MTECSSEQRKMVEYASEAVEALHGMKDEMLDGDGDLTAEQRIEVLTSELGPVVEAAREMIARYDAIVRGQSARSDGV